MCSQRTREQRELQPVNLVYLLLIVLPFGNTLYGLLIFPSYPTLFSNYSPQLFNSFSIFYSFYFFCAFLQQFETHFSQEKIRFHAGINKFRAATPKIRYEKRKKKTHEEVKNVT